MEEVGVVVINYNGGSLVLRTIESILNQKGVEAQLVVVDDGSTDGSPKDIEESFPEVNVIREEENTKDLNRLRNKGLAFIGTDRVLLTDNDVVFDKYCIEELLCVMKNDESVGACVPRLMYLDDKSRIYNEGGKIHYVGTTTAPNRDIHVDRAESSTKITVGGGIALLDTEILEHIGNFDEEYKFAWGCDDELYQRMLLTGYKCLFVPSAVGYHDFESFSKARHYRARGQVCNRWRFILTYYSARTFLLVAPALVAYEFVQASFYLLKGIPLLYLKGTFDAVQQLPEILEKRKEIQALRVAPDKDLLFSGPPYVRPGMSGKLVSAAVAVVTFLFSAYWSLIQPLLSRDRSPPSEEEEQKWT